MAMTEVRVAGADRPGHQRRHGDHQSDADRCGEKQNRAAVADRRGQFYLAQ
jgi:hypothetical protein